MPPKVHATWLAEPGYDFTRSFRLPWAVVFVAYLSVAAYTVGLPDMPRRLMQGVAAACAAVGAAIVGVWASQFVVGSALMPRSVILGSAAALVPWFTFTSAIATRGCRRARQLDRAVVIGAQEDSTALIHELDETSERPGRVVAVLHPDDAQPTEADRVPVRTAVETNAATVVVLDRDAQSSQAIVDQVALLHEQGIRVRTLSLFYEEWLGKLPIGELERVSLMFDIGEIHRLRYGRLKRLLDLSAAVLLVPVLAVVVPLVALGNLVGNRGPLLYHQPRVGKGGRGSEIRFARKAPKGPVAKWSTDRFYRVFYAGRETGTPTYGLPGGALGRLLGFVLFVIRGVLNRTGVMHTSVHFDPSHPLRCEVDRTAEESRRVAIIERGPRSGFLEGDRAVIEEQAVTRVVRYPGWPSPRFLRETWQAVGWSTVVYTFFASEHAVVAALFARARRRRFVVSVGGYDVANVPEHGYGLPSRFPHRLVPRLVMALSHRIVAFSKAARDEAVAAGADPERTTVSYIGLEPRFVDQPAGVERDPETVITVAYVDEVSWSRKGIDRFVAAARQDAARRYVLVGRVADPVLAAGLADPPPNLILAGFVSDDELRELLWSSGVYAQLSWHEGFGVSMVEAMQAGCQPVVTDVPALTEIAGPDAIQSPHQGHDVGAIARAAASPADRSALARWATTVASMDERAAGLESALFAGN